MSIRELQVDRDLPEQCCIVDALLAQSLRTGRCAPLLRTMMVAYQAGISQSAQGRNFLFEAAAICDTIKVLEQKGVPHDLTKGPFEYLKGPLMGLKKKHFFQASFLIDNILLEIKKQGTSFIYRALSDEYGRGNGPNKKFTEKDAHLLAKTVSHDLPRMRAGRRKKSRDGGLTGEHLIYAELPDKNIYLYASFHGEDQDRIEDCVGIAVKDFPELRGKSPVFDRDYG